MTNGKAITLGLQHLLAMYAGAILVPLTIGKELGFSDEQVTYLVAIDILMCGVATLIQAMRGKFFGIGLPVVLGCTFTAVFPIIAIGKNNGIDAIYGAIIASGLIVILISGIFGKLVKFFPPVVTGSVVTIIAISLVPVAMNNMGGGQGAPDFASASNIALALITLLIILVIYRFASGFIRSISILLGLILGTIVGIFMGKVDFSPVAEAGWFHMVKPFYFGTPAFDPASIITMTLVAMVSLVESSGVYFALGDIEKKKITSGDLARGYRSEGLASVIGGIFNAFPYTTFSQNVGLIKMTGVKERKVIFITGGMLVALGFFPKIAALTTIIPTAVLGGAMLAMFGMVLTQGITMLAPEILKSPENTMIVAISVALGAGVAFVPDIFKVLPDSLSILTSNGIVCGSVSAIVLNVLFNMIGPKKEKSLQAGAIKE
ncbi:nucleobase:cation symporter-2 family protein [Ureibacillus sp. FSL K6-8385]|uniref:Purine permease n=1 Tax=Ureibacillus terrenus TaxID=118246 RepID=A0A540UZ87_9BACL|nr:nucleobase:cation symporter-2 family protein [Ureibacillus terrenus]MED3662141.1 nucleobase:cation symporter-2 family protein [Ureibacillus terrenus]MED3764446.1 nucleobase:cation symporter-2 family protein [Ureibacillus terrenus]TQE89787.1 purine permease [Ureibacillus terrenus]